MEIQVSNRATAGATVLQAYHCCHHILYDCRRRTNCRSSNSYTYTNTHIVSHTCTHIHTCTVMYAMLRHRQAFFILTVWVMATYVLNNIYKIQMDIQIQIKIQMQIEHMNIYKNNCNNNYCFFLSLEVNPNTPRSSSSCRAFVSSACSHAMGELIWTTYLHISVSSTDTISLTRLHW